MCRGADDRGVILHITLTLLLHVEYSTCSLTVHSNDRLRDVERVFGDAAVLALVEF